MYDIKLIRKRPDFFLKKFTERNININLNDLLNLDKKNRDLISSKEKFEQEKKVISQKRDKSQFSKSKEVSLKIEELNKKQSIIKKQIDSILSAIPNIALNDVPIGKDEKANKEILKVGDIPNFSFKPLSHSEIGKKNGQMDFDIATKKMRIAWVCEVDFVRS